MNKVEIKGSLGKSIILTGEKLDNVNKYLPDTDTFIITDENIKAHYISRFPNYPLYTIKPGEKSKTLHKAADIYKWLLNNEADRSSYILGIGGGVVCDLAGFVASTYMRGVNFGFVATSLIAQVDASIGGKNGVNLDGFKNIIGVFNQPQFVLCDHNMLKTLPEDEYINGFSEIVKHALISDAEKFSYIEENIKGLQSADSSVLEFLVNRSVNIKVEIVNADEKEKNLRKKLNLGHTWGHAVEKVAGISHGKAVSIGLAFAAKLSQKKGLLSESEYTRIINLLKKLNLPVSINFDKKLIFDAILKDKKKTSGSIDFVLMKGIGNAIIERISLQELKNA